MKISRESFGQTKDGRQVDTIRIENSQGYSLEIITYGAYLRSFQTPDRSGKPGEITRNFPRLSYYENPSNYMGATIGRYANRIAGARFSLSGNTYYLAENSKGCQLHGGPGGFNTKVWDAYPLREENRASVKLALTSPDSDQGFPGTLDVTLTITLTEENELIFLYEAVTDAETPVSLTNHTYWNLRGVFTRGSIYDQEILIHSNRIVEVDENLLPTGKFLNVAGTPFDLQKKTSIGKNISIPNKGLGFDNNYVLGNGSDKAEVKKAAEVFDPITGRRMEVLTNAPGLQFYSDNFSQPDHAAYCLEAGELPDAMNQPNFPSPVIKPGEIYRQVTIHTFSVD
jgi:aldose 1-epimerase